MRVLVILDQSLMPPARVRGLTRKQRQPWQTEYDVMSGLRSLGYEVRAVGVRRHLDAVGAAVKEWRPHVALSLLVEIPGTELNETHVAAYLDMLGVRYAGSGVEGLVLTANKALCKQLLLSHDIATPSFRVCKVGAKGVTGVRFPAVVKPNVGGSSFGLSQASVVSNKRQLDERIRHIHMTTGQDALIEDYLPGREFTVGILGNERLEALPVWELLYGRLVARRLPIMSFVAESNPDYRVKTGLRTGRARRLSPELIEDIADLAKRAYRAAKLEGYGRIDVRLSGDNQPYVLDVNSNPDLCFYGDLALSAKSVGYSGPQLLERILRLAKRRFS